MENVTKEKLTNAKVFRLLGIKEHKSREDLVDNVLRYYAQCKVTTNIRGKVIDRKHLLSQLSNTIKDIENKKGNWKNFKVVETKTVFKLVPL